MSQLKESEIIGSVVRTGLAAVAGALIAKGVPAQLITPVIDPLTSVVVGSLTYGVVQLWSLTQKALAKKLPRF